MMLKTGETLSVEMLRIAFLGLDMLELVPHFSKLEKNYTRRFKDTDLFEQNISHILEECKRLHFVDTSTIFIEAIL